MLHSFTANKFTVLIRIVFLALFIVVHTTAFGQLKLNVALNEWARDDKFERVNMNLALFELPNDTILSWDFEGMRKPLPIKIIKPSGYKNYAYGFLFFGANRSGHSPGLVTFIIGNPYDKNPVFIPDLNNNNDFTDDHFTAAFPWRGDSILLSFCLPQNNRCFKAKITRHPLHQKGAYKELMNEFYAMNYPNRKFIGMDFSFRNQQYQVKAGTIAIGNDSFRIALYDGNNNGLFNEPDSDKMVVAYLGDTLFYPMDDLYSSTITINQGDCFIDKNGKQFVFESANANGESLLVSVFNQQLSSEQIKPGKSIPKFTYTDWRGNKLKSKKLRKYHAYIYFGSPQSTNFTNDTIMLRKITSEFGQQIKIVGFIEVNKSYELSIMGQFGKPNWTLAYKDKYINQKLGIKGLPSSVLTKKRRKVVTYHLTPQQLYDWCNQNLTK
ncbi:MAG: hypothetical protein ACK5UI_10425 [Bacteroidota bacterium]